MLTLPFAVALLLISIGFWTRNQEKRDWNKGICAKYGEPWNHFDNDSQGGRGYKCRDCTLWVSHKVDAVKPGTIS